MPRRRRYPPTRWRALKVGPKVYWWRLVSPYWGRTVRPSPLGIVPASVCVVGLAAQLLAELRSRHSPQLSPAHPAVVPLWPLGSRDDPRCHGLSAATDGCPAPRGAAGPEGTTLAHADGGTPRRERERSRGSVGIVPCTVPKLLYNVLVAEVASGWDALLKDVGRPVRAEIRAESDPLVEAQTKTQHLVAVLYTQQGELRLRMQEMEKDFENPRNRGLRARNEVMETRAPPSQAD